MIKGKMMLTELILLVIAANIAAALYIWVMQEIAIRKTRRSIRMRQIRAMGRVKHAKG